MASNPMQRKARVSFLMGMFVTLLITGVIIAGLGYLLINEKRAQNEEKKNSTSVYVLNSDVKSGQIVSMDMCTQKTILMDQVPSNAIGSSQADIFTALSLQDKEGRQIVAKSNEDGEVELTITITTEGGDKEYKLTQTEGEVKEGELATSYTYYYEDGKDRKYVELSSEPLIAKVDMYANTVITTDLVSKGNSATINDARVQEYNMISLPTSLETGDYVDIRLMLPNGQDFIVISKKEATIPDAGGVALADTIQMNLSEDETLSLSSAIIDAYQIIGSKLYAVKYTEAGLQNAATATYVPNAQVTKLIQTNPNYVMDARTALKARYSGNSVNLRNENINAQFNAAGEEGQENVKAQMQESITKAQTSRQTYLDGLGGAE